MFGKNVVCVVLMLVLVVMSWCLVSRMFGCCCSRFDGRFVGILVSRVWFRFRFCGRFVGILEFSSRISVFWFWVIRWVYCVRVVWVFFMVVCVWCRLSVEVMLML